MNAAIDNNLLSRVRVASPCQARWADMQGDERVRFCQHCQKNVYNLSAMTAADAAALVRAKEGDLCGRFYQRADGTMLTADCPVGVARHWQRVKAFAAATVATLVLTFTSVGMVRQTEAENRERSRMAQARDRAVGRIKEFLGLNKPVAIPGKIALMGDIYVPPPTNQPPPKVGRIAMPPPSPPAPKK